MSLSDVIKKGSGAPAPGDLIEGGLGIDTLNKRIYFKADDGTVVPHDRNVPAGNITATTVQAAINELDAEKLNKSDAHFRNDIINGQFRIAQIGTSFVSHANGAYDLDGWLITNNDTVAAYTVAQVAGSSAGRFARQVTITTADASVAAAAFLVDLTKISGYEIVKYVGNTFVVAFRAKVPVAGIHCVALRSIGSGVSYIHEINFPSANVWQDCSFIVSGGLPTSGTWNYTNSVGLSIAFTHMCGATYQTTAGTWNTGNFLGTANQVNDCATVGNTWAMENVTVNLGQVPLSYDTSYDDDLLVCQLYYRRIKSFYLKAYQAAGNDVGITLTYPTMNSSPVATKVGTWDVVNSGQPALFDVTDSGLGVYGIWTTTASGYIRITDGNTQYIELSARL